MDLRRWGSEYEKKYIELTEEDIQQVALNFHNWQQADYETTYKDVPEFCKSASFEDLEANDFSLVPSKYIEFVDKDRTTTIHKCDSITWGEISNVII